MAYVLHIMCPFNLNIHHPGSSRYIIMANYLENLNICNLKPFMPVSFLDYETNRIHYLHFVLKCTNLIVLLFVFRN